MSSPFEARTTDEVLREGAARIVARSSLSDVNEGSVLLSLYASVAEDIANVERRLQQIRDSFSFIGTTGADLDDRVADLPPSGLARLPATNATGGALTLRRASGVGSLLVPAGTLYGRSDDDAIVYRQVADATFNPGDTQVTGVAVACTRPGSIGNVTAGLINRAINAPDDITSSVSTLSITNGFEEETDAQLSARALDYLASLTKTTPQALEFEALSFTASDGSRAKIAKIFEDPTQPGYAELLLDDGGALEGYTRDGQPYSGTVPAGGPPTLFHEAPAEDVPTLIQYTRGGVDYALTPDQYVAIPERGLIYVNDGILQAGDTWTVSKYRVWVGLPAELQLRIEGNASDPLNSPGLRAAGVRVRITKPTIYFVELKVNLVPVAGADFDDVSLQVSNAIVEYTSTLAPGEPLYAARLYDRIMDNSDVLTVRLYVGGVDGLETLPDYSPITPRHVIRTTPAKVEIIALPETV